MIFIGSEYKKFPLSSFRNSVVEHLHEKYKERFGLFGNGWRIPTARPCDRSEAAMLYNKSKIAINISQLSSPAYSSDRLFHALASGCFTAVHYYPQCEDRLGGDGENVRYFKTIEELQAICDYYLDPNHEQERIEIGERGEKMVHREFGNEVVKKKLTQCFQFRDKNYNT